MDARWHNNIFGGLFVLSLLATLAGAAWGVLELARAIADLPAWALLFFGGAGAFVLFCILGKKTDPQTYG